MILVLQKNTPEPAIRQLLAQLALQNVKGGCVAGETSILLPLVGETWRLDPAALQALPYVQEARRLTPAYHLAARSTHPENTVVPVGDVRVGADFCLIAGPCAVESAYQIQTVAAAVKAAGAVMLRGGAFKPRTSPYTFQGLGEQGTALLVVIPQTAARYGEDYTLAPGDRLCLGEGPVLQWEDWPGFVPAAVENAAVVQYVLPMRLHGRLHHVEAGAWWNGSGTGVHSLTR